MWKFYPLKILILIWLCIKKKILFLLISNYTLFSHFLKWIKLNFSLSVENMTHKTINISSKVFFFPCFLQFFLVLFNWSFRIWCLSNKKKSILRSCGLRMWCMLAFSHLACSQCQHCKLCYYKGENKSKRFNFYSFGLWNSPYLEYIAN